MKYMNSRVSIVGIFFGATALLVLYLLSIRWNIYLPVVLFWVAVALMLGTIMYQSLKIELSSSYAKAVLLEIAVACFVFHMIYQVPYYGLRGLDAYRDMASAKGILSSGFVMGEPQYVTELSYFPMIHIFGAILSLITGIDLFSVAKWFPSLLDVALILLLYLLVRSIFKEEKIALLSALLFACLQHHILFSSLFIRETYALVLAVCCLYLYFSAKHFPHPSANYALSILCLIGTVLAHHLTSFMLLIFLSTHLLVTKTSQVSHLRRTYFGDNITGEKVTITFLSIAFVALFAYWMYVVTFPLYTLATFARDVFNPSQWGVSSYAEISGSSAASIRTIRGHIIFYGFYSFHLIFGLILLYGLLHKAKNSRAETYSSTLFLFLCGLVGFLSLYLVAPAAFPDRFLTFGWLFGFAPLVVAILRGKYKWPKRVSVFLLVGFMLFNIYMIKPIAYNPRAEGVALVTSEEDYSLANTFDFSGGNIFGHQNVVMAIYDTYNNLGTVLSLSEVNLTKFNWIIIKKKTLELEKTYYQEPRTETTAALECLATEGSTDYNKIYESNSLSVFKLRP
ncbi:MAG TPA: hypothetical protein HA348_06615 [Thermoplasmata archaeon]|nr:hypothetical protein [Thermoplasmata archaeon]